MGGKRAQAAIDFMTSYGVALLIIAIALYVIYSVGFLGPNVSTNTCTPEPGFSCGFFLLNTTGALTMRLSQATGGMIIIHGAACSSAINTTGSNPEYGNVHVTNASAYYPSSTNTITLGKGINFYSGSTQTINVTCYGSSGVASGTLGSSFFGYVWLNYTVPGYGTVVQEVAILSARYA